MATQADRKALRNNPAFRELTDQVYDNYQKSIENSIEESTWLSMTKLLEAYSDPEKDNPEKDELGLNYIDLQE